MTKFEIQYQPNSADYFQALLQQPWSVMLDSCHPFHNVGRYDIIASKPFMIVNNFSQLKVLLNRFKVKQTDNLPFCGGAIGHFSYDATDIIVGIYDWAVIVDHQEQKTHVVCQHFDTASNHHLQQLKNYTSINNTTDKTLAFHLTDNWSPDMSFEEYAHAFHQVKAYIAAGDCYQINLTQRFKTSYSGSIWQAYQQLRKKNPAPYAAFLNFPNNTSLSLSPERFLSVNNKHVETKPIKGTRPRAVDPIIDQQMADELLNSKKDFAENLMIVDLLRNDLGKVCQTGSVKVTQLSQLESFSNVHHLVSTIQGRLAPHVSAVDLLESAFPGGSITGAPKIRAMEIINAVEKSPRRIYCGCIGYIDFSDNMDMNIAIRTLNASNGQITLGAGGAIIADSQLEQEYQECFDKVNHIMTTLSDIIASHKHA